MIITVLNRDVRVKILHTDAKIVHTDATFLHTEVHKPRIESSAFIARLFLPFFPLSVPDVDRISGCRRGTRCDRRRCNVRSHVFAGHRFVGNLGDANAGSTDIDTLAATFLRGLD